MVVDPWPPVFVFEEDIAIKDYIYRCVMRSVIVRDVTFEVYFVCCTVVILIQNAAVIRKRKGRGFFEVSCNTLFHLVEHIGWGGGR